MASDVSFTRQTWVSGTAPGISAAELNRLEQVAVDLTAAFNSHNGGAQITDHPIAENDGLPGFMSGDDKEKLDGMDAANMRGWAVTGTSSTENPATQTFITVNTWNNLDTVAFTLPAGWASALIVARGACALHDTDSSGYQWLSRIVIGSTNGASVKTYLHSSINYYRVPIVLSPVLATVVTASSTVYIQAYPDPDQTPVVDPAFQWANLDYIAIRAS